MLTPRSRKPVVALSGTNLCHLATFQSPLPLPSSNDDLLTATVDLSFTHDSLSDSMIKTLEEGTEDLFDTEESRKNLGTEESTRKAKKLFDTEDETQAKNLADSFTPETRPTIEISDVFRKYSDSNLVTSRRQLPARGSEGDLLNRKTGDSQTPPSSRKRSSQNNNNDERAEVKKCLRESNVQMLSETAL